MLNDQIEELSKQQASDKKAHRQKLQDVEKYINNYQQDIVQANVLLTKQINTEIDQLEFNITFDMIMRQYEED